MSSIYRDPIATRWTPEDYRQRPREYDPALATIILDRIASGEMLPVICSQDRDMPLPGTFLAWCEEDPKLSERYERARRFGTEVNLDEMLVASTIPDPSAANVRFKALQAHIEKTHPDRYGPRATISQKPDGGAESGGLDYAAELRRRFDGMQRRIKESGKQK